jgi:hypothetical protein
LGPQRFGRFSWRPALLLLFVFATPLAGIRLCAGHAALLWTEYYVSHGTEKTRAENAFKAGRAASRAIDLLAPLPDARTAARLALSLGEALEVQNPEAALDLSSEVYSALARARSSRLRGIGLGDLADEAGALEARARARALGGRP